MSDALPIRAHHRALKERRSNDKNDRDLQDRAEDFLQSKQSMWQQHNLSAQRSSPDPPAPQLLDFRPYTP